MKIRYLLMFVVILMVVVFHFKKQEEILKQHYLVLAFVSLSQQSGYAELETRMNMQEYPRCAVEKALDIVYRGAANSKEAVFDCSPYEE